MIANHYHAYSRTFPADKKAAVYVQAYIDGRSSNDEGL